MTDRELLELAAKAAGRSIRWDGNVAVLQDFEPGIDDCSAWHPPTDDGDALRLAVRLGLHFVEISLCAVASVKVPICIEVWRTGYEDPIYTHYAQKGDKYEAVRHAIVRAAAEIGKTK